MFWIARTFLCIRCFRKLDLMANTMWMLKHSLWTSDTKPCSLTSCFMHFGLKPLNWWALLLIDVDCMCRHRSSALQHVNAFEVPLSSRRLHVLAGLEECRTGALSASHLFSVRCGLSTFDGCIILELSNPYEGQQGQHGTRNTMPVSLCLLRKGCLEGSRCLEVSVLSCLSTI